MEVCEQKYPSDTFKIQNGFSNCVLKWVPNKHQRKLGTGTECNISVTCAAKTQIVNTLVYK